MFMKDMDSNMKRYLEYTVCGILSLQMTNLVCGEKK